MAVGGTAFWYGCAMGDSGGTRIRSRRRRPARTGRVVLTLTVVALIGWGAFLLYEIFGSTSTEYDRTMADCMSKVTRKARIRSVARMHAPSPAPVPAVTGRD